MAYHCRECNMSFDTPDSLANHKAHFCVDSDWVDPEVMKRQLETEEQGLGADGGRELSFDEVKSYLKRRATGEETGYDRIGGKTIESLRETFAKNGNGLEEMHRLVMQQRASEKAEELRKLKIRQQKIRAQRNQDEREIRDLMRDLEKRKEVELRARMEREVVKRELRNLDAVQLKSIESERKQEIAQLARESEQLKMREDELMSEVAKLEDRIQNREKSFKQQQDQVEDYYTKNLNQKKDAHKNEQMQLAQYRGQRAARLKAQRQKLENDRAKLEEEMSKVNQEVARKHGPKSGVSSGSSLLVGFEATQGGDEKEELTKMVEHIQSSLGAETVRLKKLKQEHQQLVQDDQAQQLELDSQLAEIGSHGVRNLNNTSSLSEQAQNYVNETQVDIQNMLHGGGQGEDDQEKKVDGPRNPAEKRDLRRKKELGVKLQGTVVDELDRMVMETDTGAGIEGLNEPTRNNEMLRQGSNGSTAAPQRQQQSSAQQNTSQQQQQQSASMGGASRSTRQNQSASSNFSSDPILAEIEALKRDYQNSRHKDPNMLNAIQALERDYQMKQNGQNAMGRAQPQQRLPPVQQMSGQYPGYAPVPNAQHQNMYGQPQQQMGMMGMQQQPNQYGMAMPPQQMQQQMMGGGNNMMQQQMMQQQMMQQQMMMERERMQREMEEMMREKETDRYGSQQREMQQMMMQMTQALSSGGGSGSSNDGLSQQLALLGGGGGKGGSGGNGKELIDEGALRQLTVLSQGPLKNTELYRLHMEHLSELTKTRLEMDRLEQAQTLVQMQADLKRKNDEHEKEAEHELFMSEKRRQLRAARIQRILAKEMPGGNDGNDMLSKVYDPDEGLFIWFDFALGVPTRFRKLQLVYCFAIETQVQTKPKALPVADCEPENDQLQKAIFGGTRKVSKVGMAAHTRVVMEVQSVTSSGTGGQPRFESIGWTALDFFTPVDGVKYEPGVRLELNSGLHRLPLQRGSIQWQKLDDVSLPTTPHITLYVRVVGAGDNGRAKIMSIEPSVCQYNYRYPNAIKGVTRGQQGGGRGGRGRRGRGGKRSGQRDRSHASEFILFYCSVLCVLHVVCNVCALCVCFVCVFCVSCRLCVFCVSCRLSVLLSCRGCYCCFCVFSCVCSDDLCAWMLCVVF